MKSFQHKRRFISILYSKPVLIFLGILVLFFMWGMFGFLGKMITTGQNKKIAENKVAQLKKEKEQLSTDIAKLNNSSGVEESIRQKFGLAKEGEGVIVIVEDKNQPKQEKEDSGGFFSFLFFWKNWGK